MFIFSVVFFISVGYLCLTSVESYLQYGIISQPLQSKYNDMLLNIVMIYYVYDKWIY